MQGYGSTRNSWDGELGSAPSNARLGLHSEANCSHTTSHAAEQSSLCSSHGKVAPRNCITQGFLFQRANGA